MEHGDEIVLGRAPDGSPGWKLTVYHVPGHARGHLAFQESRYGAIAVGDLVSTLSTILVDPSDGQEIVARTQYLGRLKERLHRFGFEGPAPVAGTRLFGEPFGDQACGTVVNAAPAPSGAQFLAVVQQAAADAGPLAIGSPEGPRATLLPLPYAVPMTAPRPRP